jgi:uncharacterized protein (TIGR02271 family)
MATKVSTAPAIVGVFADQREAQKAVSDLRAAGFDENEIGLVTQNPHGAGLAPRDGAGDKAPEGAAVGAATGLGIGALWALGIAAGILPAIGPAIAGGIFASILASAATGAAVGGLVGALVGLGIPEAEAKYYESEVKAGRTIVTVVNQNRVADAIRILRTNGASVRHSDDTTGHPHFQGTSRFAKSQTTAHGRSPSDREDTDACMTTPRVDRETQTSSIDLKKEEVRAHKTNEQVGEVRIRKDVITERKSVDVPVTREEVVIERRPVHFESRGTDQVRAGGEIRIPVKEEKVQVDRETVVNEKVSVGKRKVTQTAQVETDVKREELHVEKEGQAPLKDERKKRPL